MSLLVDNSFYDHLGEDWYSRTDHPIALLRAESRWRNPWVLETLRIRLGSAPLRVLDLGCGAGFLSNELAKAGHAVTGLDASAPSLAIAAARDSTRTARYELGDALALSRGIGEFDAVCAMDFLEHVDQPDRVVSEAARVLRPGGLFFFYTFNRNPLSWLIAIKGVEWLVKNTPPHLHTLEAFIRPAELEAYCASVGLKVEESFGVRPDFGKREFWKMIRTGRVEDGFAFKRTSSRMLAYCGFAIRSS